MKDNSTMQGTLHLDAVIFRPVLVSFRESTSPLHERAQPGGKITFPELSSDKERALFELLGHKALLELANGRKGTVWLKAPVQEDGTWSTHFDTSHKTLIMQWYMHQIPNYEALAPEGLSVIERAIFHALIGGVCDERRRVISLIHAMQNAVGEGAQSAWLQKLEQQIYGESPMEVTGTIYELVAWHSNDSTRAQCPDDDCAVDEDDIDDGRHFQSDEE